MVFTEISIYFRNWSSLYSTRILSKTVRKVKNKLLLDTSLPLLYVELYARLCVVQLLATALEIELRVCNKIGRAHV